METSTYYTAARYVALLSYRLVKGGDAPKKPESISWDTVFEVSRAHTLASLVYYSLGNKPEDMSDEVYTRLEKNAATDFAKHINQAQAMSEIDTALSENGIPHLFLKGFLLKEAWGNPAYRSMGDIDIYVSEEHVTAAANALIPLGYTKSKDMYMHLEMVKPPFVEIELHKHLFDEYDKPFSDFREDTDIPYKYHMSAADTLVYVVRHAAKHYINGGSGIRNILDIRFYIDKYCDDIDEAYLIEELKKHECFEFYAAVIRICDSWISGSEISDESDREMEKYIFSGGVYGSFKNRTRMRTKEKSKIAYVLGYMFPSYKSMAKKFPVLKRHKYLLPVLYVYRLVAALFNGKSKRLLSSFDRK